MGGRYVIIEELPIAGLGVAAILFQIFLLMAFRPS